MAVTTGINSGFVTVAPTDDPTATVVAADKLTRAVKDTCPANVDIITEVGFWVDNFVSDVSFEVGLYSHNAGTNKPDALLYSETGNTIGGTAGWKKYTNLNWEVTSGTIYWIAIQLDDTASNTNTNYTGSGGRLAVDFGGATALPNPFLSDVELDYAAAHYAVVAQAAEYVEITGTIVGTSNVSGTLDTSLTQVNLTSTVTGTSSVSGNLTLGANWQTSTFKNTKRLILAANDSIWYEDI